MTTYVYDTLTPFNSSFGVVDASKVVGGFHNVATIAARNAILTTGMKQAGMFVAVAEDGKVYRLEDNLSTWTEVIDFGGGGDTPLTVEEFDPTNGQTVFVLAAAPLTAAQLIVSVRGNIQRPGVDYTLSGLTLTWLDTDFTLAPGDIVKTFF